MQDDNYAIIVETHRTAKVNGRWLALALIGAIVTSTVCLGATLALLAHLGYSPSSVARDIVSALVMTRSRGAPHDH